MIILLRQNIQNTHKTKGRLRTVFWCSVACL